MSIAKYLAVYIFSVLAVVKISISCLCMPSHPQEHLCYNNTFVALLKVRSEEYVYADDSENDLPRTDEEKLDYLKNNVINEHDNSIEFSRQVTFRPPPKRRDVVVNNLEQLPYNDYISTRVRYRVKIYETYKGIDAASLKDKAMYLYTAPDEAVCGRKLHPKKTYIIIGRIDGGRLTVGLCDHVIVWDSLDVRQKRNVRRNMRDAPRVCQSKCEVQMCGWSDCSNSKPNVCLWSPEMEKSSYKLEIQSSNFMCVPTSKYGDKITSCSWRNAVTDKKRKRKRRRRHHELAKKLLEAKMSKSINSGLLP